MSHPSPAPERPRSDPILAVDTAIRHGLRWIARGMGGLLLLLMAVIIFDVVTRRFLVIGSTELQELEWHLHTAILMLVLGYTYVRDGHVRIGLLRDRWSPRAQAWVEAVGCVVFLLPFCAVTLFYGVDFAATSFLQNESSPSPTGLGQRWLVKATVPAGMVLLLLAGVSVFLRSVLVLLRPGLAPAVFEADDGRRSEGDGG